MPDGYHVIVKLAHLLSMKLTKSPINPAFSNKLDTKTAWCKLAKNLDCSGKNDALLDILHSNRFAKGHADMAAKNPKLATITPTRRVGRNPMKRFQFSIRDMLLVTAIIALALGWWMDHSDLKWTTAKDRDFEAGCKLRAEKAEAEAEATVRFFNTNAEIKHLTRRRKPSH